MRCCVTLEQSEDPYARDLLEIAGEISGKRRQKVKNTIGKKKRPEGNPKRDPKCADRGQYMTNRPVITKLKTY